MEINKDPFEQPKDPLKQKLKDNFSFNRLFNHVKGIEKAYQEDQIDTKWLETSANDEQKNSWKEFYKYCDKQGIQRDKIQYPVLFGKGDSRYQGAAANVDIEKGDIIVRVPSELIITTKKAYFSEIQHIFYDHPEVFGKHKADGEDMVINAFLLLQIQKGKDSPFYEMIKTWPKDADILLNWEEEDLEELQDPTLMEESEKQYTELLDSWNRLYEVLN